MADELDLVTLGLDGRWTLQELSDTTRDYIQLYGFIYSLLPDLPVARQSEVNYIYGKLPWRGGFSTINFFRQLFSKIPVELRPEIIRIQYASPGFIELGELLRVALEIAGVVSAISGALVAANQVYRNIQKGATELRLSQIDLASKELDLTQRQIEFCISGSRKLEHVLGLTPEQIENLNERTQNNPIMKLKILLSVFRRAESLAEKQKEERLDITAQKMLLERDG